MPRYGFHLSIAGKKGVAGAVEEATALGLTAFQIFAKSPRSWRPRALSPAEVEAFRALREASGGLPAVIHASYLVNLGAEGELWEKSVASLADDLEKAALLGVEYVVVHPGSGRPERVKEGALKALRLAGVRSRPVLLVENTAGGGEKVGARFEELAWLVADTPSRSAWTPATPTPPGTTWPRTPWGSWTPWTGPWAWSGCPWSTSTTPWAASEAAWTTTPTSSRERSGRGSSASFWTRGSRTGSSSWKPPGDRRRTPGTSGSLGPGLEEA